MWDLTGPGLEPVSPALAGGFLTTAPPGKPQEVLSINPPLSKSTEDSRWWTGGLLKTYILCSYT